MFLFDGLGDERYRELGNKTPLEAARTPVMDALADNGFLGSITPAGLGKEVPITDASNVLLAVLGYDVRKVKPRVSRGVIEALGAGLHYENGWLAARCDLSHVQNGVIKVLRVKKQAKQVERVVNSVKLSVPFVFKHEAKHRGVLIFKTRFAGADIVVPYEHRAGGRVFKSRALNKASEKAARVVNEFLEKTSQALSKSGLSCNTVLPRGFGCKLPKLVSFGKRFGVRGVGLCGLGVDVGVCKLAGLPVVQIEQSGEVDEVKVKRKPFLEALKKHDFVLLHFKNTDTAGHRGDLKAKIKSIEANDAFIGGLKKELADCIVIVTGDHRTSCAEKAHVRGSVPCLVSSSFGVGKRKFGENDCTDFSLLSHELLDLVLINDSR